MKHGFIDKYSNLNSFVHRLDPRVKLITAFAFVVAVVTTPPTIWWAFTCYLVLLLGLILCSKVPLAFALKRSLVIIPFVVLIAIFIPFFKQGEVAGSYNIWLWKVSITYSGLLILWNVVIKAWLSALSAILLTATTPFPNLLKGMEQLRLPKLMVTILSFMYRYIFVLGDEVLRMKRARDSRNFGGNRLWGIKTMGNMIGSLFIRSYERGERVYQAMLCRGFDGQVRTLNSLQLTKFDLCFASIFLISIALVGIQTHFGII
jgi:cobalt/nickel transport system permease protein